jgi:hypothetical protein
VLVIEAAARWLMGGCEHTSVVAVRGILKNRSRTTMR